MRIISGKNKGQVFNFPKNVSARPTTDRAKESLFNILNNYYYFEGLVVLDLFSGTGNISFEFASRGAEKVISVEKDSKAARFISKESKRLELEQIVVWQDDVFQSLMNFPEQFDIVFADPPYGGADCLKLLEMVREGNLLKKGGRFILEHPKNDSYNGFPGFQEKRDYGGTSFSFFSWEEN